MTKHRVTCRLLAVALSVLLVLGCVAPAVAATYESGTYTGTGTGRNGSVALTLTLTNGAIASVDNVTHSETARYWEKAKVLLDQLVGLQTPEQVEKLDAVTGATLSSNAIKEAAKDVFRQAESKETPVFASGSGTKSDPYLIRTAAQLQAFAAAVNGGTGYEGQYISLDADLDLTGTAWTPIGATGSFNGSFNGNYHTITGMTIGSESEKASYTEAGLFGSVGKGAAIRNVGVIHAAIYNKTATDPSVGLLAAGISENSIVESCWATGTIYSDTTSPYYSYVGGLVGSIGIKSLICNSWTNVVVYAKGSSDSFVGGIVGDTGNNSAVVNCAALGSVANYGNTSMMYGAGGVVGYSSGAVYASYSSSRIHMDAMSSEDGADVPVGGVVGSPSALSAAYNCYFNKEEKQTYYDGEVSTPLAVGYDVLNYSESDNDHCEGLTAAEIASETLLNKLTAALTPEELAKGQAYFKSESLLTGDITLDSLLSMTENGWCTWERNADGALLPTAGGSVTPEEPDYFAGGDGSVGDPYQIATEAQLRAFAEATQAGKLVTTNVCFVLTADIALNGEWTPVHSFGGTFDGGDHTVSGMTIGTADAPSKLVSAGFFDVLANTARVHDLHLTNASVYVQRSGAALDDRIYAGGLVGGAGTAGSNVRIDNCSVTGSTISAASGTFAYAGGLAGRLDRENVVTNCWTDIAVTAVSANSPACAGGLVATIGGSSMIANAAALGDVSVTGVSAEYNWCRAGGLLGSSAYLTHNCYASGNVSLQNSAESVKNVYLGCLIGEQSGGVVVSGHYFNGAVLRYNGGTQTAKATGSIPSSWYFDYNKITVHDSVTDAAFAAAMNDGISESGIAETDAYLTSSGKFTSYTAESLAAMRPAAWQSWGLADGKVVLGGSQDDPTFAGGDGSETAPFLIRTEAQLRAFAATTADGETYAGQYVALDADIPLNGDWTPIHSFAGTFDGQGHTVSGMTIGTESAPADASDTPLGFFDILANDARVRNLHLTGVSIYGSAVGQWTRPFVGGIAGGSLSIGSGVRIDNCSVTGSAISLTAENWAYTGGILGAQAMNGVITNCWTDVTVSAISKSGLTCVGGITAINSNGAMLANCAALGDVISHNGYTLTSTISGAAGGLIGQATGLLHNCYASGNIELVNAMDVAAPAAGMLAGKISASRALNGLVVGCRYETASVVTANGTQIETAAAGAMGDTVRLENVSAADTGAKTFADTMNEGLSTAGLGRTDRWLTGEDVGFTAEELAALRPAAWYAWERNEDGKTVLSARVYEDTEIPTPDFFDSGDGTEKDPWIIRTLAQLQAFRAFFAKSDFDGAYIALTADLDLTGAEWAPIGHTDRGVQAFRGHFDGRGHTISGMSIGTASAPVTDTTKTYYGLFAALMDGASVEDLRVEGSIYVTGEQTVSAGLLAGCSDLALIDRCYAAGTVQVRTENGSFANSSFAGGLIGYSQRSEIYNCGADVALDAYCKTANAEAGGITAMNAFGIIANSYATGTLTAATDRTVDDSGVSYLGGIAGCQAGTLVNCYSDCTLTSKTWTKFVGALGGMATAISESYDSYYAEDVALTIEDQRLDPPVAFGTVVPSGYNEDGDLLNGAFIYNVTAMTLEPAALAAALNENFAAFPVDPAELTVPLLRWTVVDGKAVPRGGAAGITYVPVEKPDPTPEYAYQDGVYYGRDEAEHVIVRIVVKDGKIVSAEIVTPKDFDAGHAEEILAAVVSSQTVERADSDTADDSTLKSALKVALNRALLGDTSTYDPADPTAIFDGGSGTKADPYRIATADQLRAFAAAVNEEEHFAGEYIVLTADIDLAGRKWVPAGNAGAHCFSGIFDGQNHKILGLRIGTEETPADYVAAGLFAYADGAIIRNVAIENAQINIKRTDSVRIYAGIVAGVMDKSETGAGALITNCAVSGTVSASSKDWSTVGGIVGQSYDSVILNCSAHVDLTTVSVSGSALAGGIVGLDGFSILANSYAMGSIYADAGVNAATIGGIAGMQAGVAGNNYSDMKLTSKNATGDIGGIAGRNTAIGTVNYGYFNSEQEQRSGNSVVTPAKDIGTNVTMGSTGVVRNTAAMTGAELRSETFRDLLNENQCEDHELRSALQDGVTRYSIKLRADGSLTVDSWILDGEVRQKNAPVLELDPQVPEAPVITPDGGSYAEAQTVTITADSADAAIYYTLDGSDPLNGTLYTGPFTLEQSAVVRAVAVRGNSVSAETRVEFTIETVHNAVLSFVSNGGSVVERVELPVGTALDLSAYVTEREGYDFTGWYLDAALTQPITSLTLEADTTVYAGWRIRNPFVDVAEKDYFYDAVLWGVENGVVKGMDETHFEPETVCTRAQALTFLWRANGMPQPKTTTNPFVDVDASAYYYDAVLWGVENGIVKGMDETHFEPDTACSRAHALTFLWRAKGMPQASGTTFADVPANAYYAQAVAWGVENGIVKGMDETHFEPDTLCQRAHAVTFLWRAYAN